MSDVKEKDGGRGKVERGKSMPISAIKAPAWGMWNIRSRREKDRIVIAVRKVV